jgi:surface protein
MFHGASAFNVDITGWETSNVTNMESMFFDAINISNESYIKFWDMGNLTHYDNMFGTSDNKSYKNITEEYKSNVYKNINNSTLSDEEKQFKANIRQQHREAALASASRHH